MTAPNSSEQRNVIVYGSVCLMDDYLFPASTFMKAIVFHLPASYVVSVACFLVGQNTKHDAC